MKAYEALLLGASAFPCVRDHYSDGDSGCLLTNMGRALGWSLGASAEAANRAHQCQPSGPLVAAFPVLGAFEMNYWHDAITMQIVERYDSGQSPDEIASWLREIETGAIGLGVAQARESAEVTA